MAGHIFSYKHIFTLLSSGFLVFLWLAVLVVVCWRVPICFRGGRTIFSFVSRMWWGLRSLVVSYVFAFFHSYIVSCYVHIPSRLVHAHLCICSCTLWPCCVVFVEVCHEANIYHEANRWMPNITTNIWWLDVLWECGKFDFAFGKAKKGLFPFDFCFRWVKSRSKVLSKYDIYSFQLLLFRVQKRTR